MTEECPDLRSFGYDYVRHLETGGQTREVGCKLYRHLNTNELHAIKFELLEGFQRSEDLKRAAREVRNQWRCDHRHIARIKRVGVVQHALISSPDRPQWFLFLSMEYAEGGEVLHAINKVALQGTDKKRLCAQIVSAVEYMHRLKIWHRDLKLENLLLDVNGNIKICDFGLSKSQDFDSMPRSNVSTTAYCAPELLGSSGDRPYDGEKIDVWCLGVCFYVIEYRRYPFGAEPYNTIGEIYNNIANVIFVGPAPARPDNNGLDALLRLMFQKSPAMRPTMRQVATHPFFEGYTVMDQSDENLKSPAGMPLQTAEEADLVFEQAVAIVEEFDKHRHKMQGLDLDEDLASFDELP